MATRRIMDSSLPKEVYQHGDFVVREYHIRGKRWRYEVTDATKLRGPSIQITGSKARALEQAKETARSEDADKKALSHEEVVAEGGGYEIVRSHPDRHPTGHYHIRPKGTPGYPPSRPSGFSTLKNAEAALQRMLNSEETESKHKQRKGKKRSAEELEEDRMELFESLRVSWRKAEDLAEDVGRPWDLQRVKGDLKALVKDGDCDYTVKESFVPQGGEAARTGMFGGGGSRKLKTGYYRFPEARLDEVEIEDD